MLGGLYGDLPPPSSASEDDKKPGNSSTAAVWSSSVKMAPPTLRKPAFTPPPSALRPKTVISAAVKTLIPEISPSPPQAPASIQPALVSVTATVVEEYDPARPNDYEDYRREKKRRAKEAEVRRELERRQLEEEERDRERDRDHERVVSGEEAWRRRAAMSGARSPSPVIEERGEREREREEREREGGFSIGKSESGGLGVGAGGQMTAAQRMMAKMGWKEGQGLGKQEQGITTPLMAKMGWKEGQGLGKQEQGITTPLMAKKTDRRAGVIVNASETKQQQQQQQVQEKKIKSVNFNMPPTRVLLLRNMVGPGEVDDELEDEVASECAKYGTVTRVLIFEITEPDFPVDEAVRIFVQFERAEQATKAYTDLDGRFFGGRVVRAAFYEEERFSNNELAPLLGEVPGF